MWPHFLVALLYLPLYIFRLMTNTGCNKFKAAYHARGDKLSGGVSSIYFIFVDHKILGNLGSYFYTLLKVDDCN